jgi:hypothetical protein
MSIPAHIKHLFAPLDQTLRAPQVDYPCYACGEESTHEIIHRGAPLDVCDRCDQNDGANYDGAPWCSGCGARSAWGCKCGPIAENE